MGNPLARDLDEVLARTGDLWNELRGARIFLTGGTGFFGCWLLETLLWANEARQLDASVVVLTRDRRAFENKARHLARHPSVTIHEGDLRACTLPSGPFSHVVHAATESRAVESGPDRIVMFETIVDGTRRTLEMARKTGARRFLLTSSGAVYGRQPSELSHVPEDFSGAPEPSNPANVYAEGKRAAELLCALHADENLQPTIARCFAFVGPYLPLDVHFAVGNFIRDALQGGPVQVSSDGTPCRSYLYAADLAVWLWTILLRGRPLRPYNVGSETVISIADLAGLVARVLGKGSDVRIAETPRPGAAPRYVPSTARARTELGLQAVVGLEDAIERSAAWHRGHGGGAAA
jgi:dTDP-glucose 4,6-dehydratase